MTRRDAVSTNDTIIGVVERGSFHFPIEFEMMGIRQSINNAVYDTGCSHSLISVDSLSMDDNYRANFKEKLLYDVHTSTYIGSGVESSTPAKKKELAQLGKQLKQLNNLKNNLIGNKDADVILQKQISLELKNTILDPNNKNIRFGYRVSDFKIDGVVIGDFEIRLAFNMGSINLIGMHIIRELYTKIFSGNNHIYLLAKKNSLLADAELDAVIDELKEHFEFLDTTILESNYINKQLKQ
jgi:hypothetical protein